MRGRTILLALVALALVAQPIAAAETGPDAINFDADSAHNPYIAGDVTKTTHEVGDDPLVYETNDGETTSLPAKVNDSAANPFSLVFSDVEADAYSDFPVNTQTESVDSAVNASGWATDASGTAGSVSVSDTTTAPNVEAVQVSTSSQTSGDLGNASFDGFSIDSDAQKRYFSIVVDVSTLDSGANVTIRAVDDDGDYVAAEIDPDDDASTGNTMANSTGEGYVFQQRVGEMTVYGSGDGTMGAINSTKVVVEDADATIAIAGLDVEHQSAWTLADQRYDDNGDGDKDSTRTLTQINESGAVNFASLDSLGNDFSTATLKDLTVEFHAYSSMMPEDEDWENTNVSYEEADGYPSFSWITEHYQRLSVPTAYDLSYANLELRVDQPLPENRYRTVEYGTDVGDTTFENVSYTDDTSSFTAKDETVTLATGLSAGNEAVVSFDYLVTDGEYDALTMDMGSGGGAPMDDDSGGIGSIPLIGGVLTAVLAFLGLRGSNSGGA
jgi:hypothetical protein